MNKEKIKRAIELRLALAKTPVSKYEAMRRRCGSDSRVRGNLIYHGASTGRFASVGINLQNLPRPSFNDTDRCISLFPQQDPATIDLYYGNTMEALSSCIRGMITAPQGKRLLVADYSSIEARVLAWLAGQQDVIDVFNADGKIYEHTAAKIYRVPINQVTKEQRFIGKTACIARGQLVLTKSGLKPIETITNLDKVWDGVEWVSTDGAICKGIKEVITYDGLTATEDHIVFTATGRQIPFGTCARKQIPLAKTGLSGQEIRLGRSDKPASHMGQTQRKTQREVWDLLNCGHRHRFTVSNTLVHNCLALGYQGGKAAFQGMAENYGVEIADDLAEKIKNDWREANQNIVRFWWALNEAAMQTVRTGNPSKTPYQGITFHIAGGFLFCRLPSGRYLAYHQPQIGIGTFGNDAVTYMGVNGYSRKWERQQIYGGKLCIAKGTPVLTEKGWIAIENVTSDLKVWDGSAWVAHKGAIYQGEKETIEAHGVDMTADHLILTTKGWKNASQSKGYNRAESRLPNSGALRGLKWAQIPLVGGLHLWEEDKDERNGAIKAKQTRDKSVLRVQETRDNRGKTKDAWNEQTPCLRGLALHAGALPKSQTSSIQKLWGAGHLMLSTMAVIREFLGRHARGLPHRINTGQDRQQRRLRKDELPLGNKQNPSEKQTRQSTDKNPMGENDSSRSIGKIRHKTYNPAVPTSAKMPAGQTIHPCGRTQSVYDLVDCGKQHRFVVRDKHGLPLIVHNCENISQGVARDLMANAMLNVEQAGYEIVLSVHDELIAEAPTDFGSIEEFIALMCKHPDWAQGLPLSADGESMKRYRK